MDLLRSGLSPRFPNGWILALVGYVSTDVTDLAKLGIVLLCGPLPVLWYLAGLWIFKGYPIDRAFYEAMLGGEEAQ